MEGRLKRLIEGIDAWRCIRKTVAVWCASFCLSVLFFAWRWSMYGSLLEMPQPEQGVIDFLSKGGSYYLAAVASLYEAVVCKGIGALFMYETTCTLSLALSVNILRPFVPLFAMLLLVCWTSVCVITVLASTLLLLWLSSLFARSILDAFVAVSHIFEEVMKRRDQVGGGDRADEKPRHCLLGVEVGA
jgi:hypothetical protein